MPKATEKELAGALALATLIEAEGEVADVEVDGQRDERESPGGDVQHGAERGQADQGNAVAECHPLAQCRVGDRHHAVSAARVVLAEVPAQCVEVRELPRVEERPQQQST